MRGEVSGNVYLSNHGMELLLGNYITRFCGSVENPEVGFQTIDDELPDFGVTAVEEAFIGHFLYVQLVPELEVVKPVIFAWNRKTFGRKACSYFLHPLDSAMVRNILLKFEDLIKN